MKSHAKFFRWIICGSVMVYNICYTPTAKSAGIRTNIEVAVDHTPFQIIVKFLKWYKQNKGQISSSLVKGGGKDSNSIYRVDFEAVEKYIERLKKSGYLSSAFLSNLRGYLELCDANFKKHPQTDFIAQGFESDLITKLMDDVDLMENVNSLKPTHTSITGNRAVVKLKPTQLSAEMIFELRKISGIWKIDSINGDFATQIPQY